MVIEIKVEHAKDLGRLVIYDAVQLLIEKDGSSEGTLVVTGELIQFANALDSGGIGNQCIVTLVAPVTKGVGKWIVSRITVHPTVVLVGGIIGLGLAPSRMYNAVGHGIFKSLEEKGGKRSVCIIGAKKSRRKRRSSQK